MPPCRVLLLGWDPDLLQLLREYLRSVETVALVEAGSDDEARALLDASGVDVVIAEGPRLRRPALRAAVADYPLIHLTDMPDTAAEPAGASPPSQIRLPKPASLRAIGQALERLRAALSPSVDA